MAGLFAVIGAMMVNVSTTAGICRPEKARNPGC
jgi:hypothetical protein